MTLLILAHPRDDVAHQLAERWSDLPALVLSARDLSASGWEHHALGPGEDVLALGGRTVRASELTAVLVRIAAISERELPHIQVGDRAYVAAEMNAFLLSFLTRLRCPVVNRPMPGSLMGPAWSAPLWSAMAVRCGFLAPAPELSAAGFASSAALGRARLVTVVGERCLGTSCKALAGAALRLARAARVELLALRASEAEAAEPLCFWGVEPWSNVAEPEVAQALGALLLHAAQESQARAS